MDVGNKRVDGRVHIRLCTRGEKERGRAGDNKSWEERKMKRGGRGEKEGKGRERNFFSSQFYFIGVPFGLTLTSSDHFYWHQAMNLKLRQWGTFSSLPGFANLLHDKFLPPAKYPYALLVECSRSVVNIFAIFIDGNDLGNDEEDDDTKNETDVFFLEFMKIYEVQEK